MQVQLTTLRKIAHLLRRAIVDALVNCVNEEATLLIESVLNKESPY